MRMAARPLPADIFLTHALLPKRTSAMPMMVRTDDTATPPIVPLLEDVVGVVGVDAAELAGLAGGATEVCLGQNSPRAPRTK